MSRSFGTRLASLALGLTFTFGTATAMAQYQQQPYPPAPAQPPGPPPKPTTPYPPAPPPAPPAGYQAPPAGYQAPPAGYQAPPAGYQAPPAGYQAPPAGYQAPPPGYPASDPNAYPPAAYPPPAPMPPTPAGPARFAQKGQKLLSGTLGATLSSGTLKDRDDATLLEVASNQIIIEPQVSYFLADGFALGANLLIDIENVETNAGGVKNDATNNTTGALLDGTFHIVNSENLAFYVGAAAGYATGKQGDNGENSVSGPVLNGHGGVELIFGGDGRWGLLKLGVDVLHTRFALKNDGNEIGNFNTTNLIVSTGIGLAWQ